MPLHRRRSWPGRPAQVILLVGGGVHARYRRRRASGDTRAEAEFDAGDDRLALGAVRRRPPCRSCRRGGIAQTAAVTWPRPPPPRGSRRAWSSSRARGVASCRAGETSLASRAAADPAVLLACGWRSARSSAVPGATAQRRRRRTTGMNAFVDFARRRSKTAADVLHQSAITAGARGRADWPLRRRRWRTPRRVEALVGAPRRCPPACPGSGRAMENIEFELALVAAARRCRRRTPGRAGRVEPARRQAPTDADDVDMSRQFAGCTSVAPAQTWRAVGGDTHIVSGEFVDRSTRSFITRRSALRRPSWRRAASLYGARTWCGSRPIALRPLRVRRWSPPPCLVLPCRPAWPISAAPDLDELRCACASNTAGGRGRATRLIAALDRST